MSPSLSPFVGGFRRDLRGAFEQVEDLSSKIMGGQLALLGVAYSSLLATFLPRLLGDLGVPFRGRRCRRDLLIWRFAISKPARTFISVVVAPAGAEITVCCRAAVGASGLLHGSAFGDLRLLSTRLGGTGSVLLAELHDELLGASRPACLAAFSTSDDALVRPASRRHRRVFGELVVYAGSALLISLR